MCQETDDRTIATKMEASMDEIWLTEVTIFK